MQAFATAFAAIHIAFSSIFSHFLMFSFIFSPRVIWTDLIFIFDNFRFWFSKINIKSVHIDSVKKIKENGRNQEKMGEITTQITANAVAKDSI